MKYLKLLFLILFIYCSQVVASNSQFECEILNHSSLQDDGSLEKNLRDKDVIKNLIGKKFLVDRKTGDIKGDVYFSNIVYDSYKRKPFFIEDGSAKRAFRAIWIQKSNQYTAYSGVVYIQIFTPVTETKKPFLVNSGTSVVTGLCN
jgi:hypothetical protein